MASPTVTKVDRDSDTLTPGAIASVSAKSVAKRGAILDVVAVGLACIIFLGISLYQLDLPGLYPDEAFDVIPSMQLLLGHPVDLQRGAGVHIAGLDLPLMSSSDYQGVTSTYLVIPFFALGGINVISLRIMTVLAGVLALILTFFLTRAWFGAAEARLATFLLAVSPSWIFWSRIGVYVVSEVVPITVGALLAFTIWLRRKPLGERNGPLYIGFFLLGLGLATKLLYLWIFTALFLCVVILYGRQIWNNRHEWIRDLRRWAAIALASAGAFCLGAFPLLLYNAMTRGTINFLRYSSGSATTANGVSNSAFVRNLWTEADAFRTLLDGSYFWFQGVDGRTYANFLAPAVLALSALSLVALALIRREGFRRPSLRRLAFPVALLSVALAMSAALVVIQLDRVLVGDSDAYIWLALIWLLILGSIVTGVCGLAWVLVTAFRSESGFASSGWSLLAFGSLFGAIWWFGGSGRPETPMQGMPFGLWPADAAGVLFWLAGVALALVLGFDKLATQFQRVVTAMLAITGVVIAQSAVTVSGLWATHLLLLLPLPQIIVAAAVIALTKVPFGMRADAASSKRLTVLRAGVVTIVSLVLIGSDLRVDYLYHRDLGITGGAFTFSDAIYRLAIYLDSVNPRPPIVAMDWGLKRPLQFLTKERVNPIEAFGYTLEPTPEFIEGLRTLLRNPGTLYVFHTPTGTAYPRFDAFNAEVEAEGKKAVLVSTAYHRDGKPFYLVYEAK